jgi:hypothetical protein
MKIRLEKLVDGKPANGQVPKVNVAQPVVLPPELMDFKGAPTRFDPGVVYDVPENVAEALKPFGATRA